MKDIIWREFFLLDLKGKIMLPDELGKLVLELKTIGVKYRVDGLENLKEKYPFYRECGYPYSVIKN